MVILVVFIFLSIGIFLLHLNVQKKSWMLHNDISVSLQLHLNAEFSKKESLKKNKVLNADDKTDYKLNVLKQQVQLLEIISNQTN